MRYVVTGGSGFIGSHLVKKLQSLDAEVIIIDRITNHKSLLRLDYAKKTISDRTSTHPDSSVKKAADITLVSSENSTSKLKNRTN